MVPMKPYISRNQRTPYVDRHLYIRGSNISVTSAPSCEQVNCTKTVEITQTTHRKGYEGTRGYSNRRSMMGWNSILLSRYSTVRVYMRVKRKTFLRGTIWYAQKPTYSRIFSINIWSYLVGFFFSSHLLSWHIFSLSFQLVTQIRGHIIVCPRVSSSGGE